MKLLYKICLLKNFLKNNYTFFITDFELGFLWEHLHVKKLNLKILLQIYS